MILTLLFVLVLSAPAFAQSQGGNGAMLPPACRFGEMFFKSGASAGPYWCSGVDTWSAIGGSSEGVPAGANFLIDSGTCPTGYTENTALSGKALIGTIAANGDVGTTGGSDTITPAGTTAAISAGTPAGTNSAPTFTGTAWSAPAIAWPAGVPTHTGTAATFTGTALGTHAHELPWQIPTTTTIRQIAVATFGTGTSRAATAVSAAGTANTTSAAVALSQAVSAGTPAGTVTITSQGTIAWPAGVPTIGAYTPAGSISAPVFTGTALGTHTHTFTGTPFDNRSAFVRMIVCKKT